MVDWIYHNPFIAYARHRVITDEKGNPVDYEFLEVNIAFENLTGVKGENLIGKTLKEAIPEIERDSFDWVKFLPTQTNPSILLFSSLT